MFRKHLRWREKFFSVKICDNELGGHLPHTLCSPAPRFLQFFPQPGKQQMFFPTLSGCFNKVAWLEELPRKAAGDFSLITVISLIPCCGGKIRELHINWCRISFINSISSPAGIFESMLFLFPVWWDMFVSWRVKVVKHPKRNPNPRYIRPH